jgi:preprotein translocase subunit SecG
MAQFHAGNLGYYQKYERGQKHGIGQSGGFRIFSRHSDNEPAEAFNRTTSMLTATLILAALVLLLATDHDDGHRQAIPVETRDHDTRSRR